MYLIVKEIMNRTKIIARNSNLIPGINLLVDEEEVATIISST
jgi:hypothetical protein